MGKGKADNSHTVRVAPELWTWFKTHHRWRGAFSFFVNEVLSELREIQGEKMPPQEAAKKVAEGLNRRL